MVAIITHPLAQPGLWSDAYNVVGIVVGIIAFLGFIWGAAKAWSRMMKIYDVIVGDKGGKGTRLVRPLVDIVDEHTKTLEFVITELAEIRRQVTPNGGDTDAMADRVIRIEGQLTNAEVMTEEVTTKTTTRKIK